MLYRFFGAESGADAVKCLGYICHDHTLLARAPTAFNDPFEFKVAIDFDAEENVIRRRYFEDNPTNTATDYEKWRTGFTGNFKWWLSQETRKHLMSSCGVLCFTNSDDNHLLWSHYATDHRGFCVGFDESIASGISGVKGHGPVTYQCDAPVFRYYYDKAEAFATKVFSYKSDRWAYEREYRIVVEQAGVVAFPESALREVILGCRAYGELRTYADTRLDKVNFGFFQMVEDFYAYSLRKERIEPDVRLMTSFF